MPCLTSGFRSYYQDRLTYYLAELVKLDEAFMAASIEIEEYKLNTGEGMQQTQYRDLDKLTKSMGAVEARITWLMHKLNGTGLANMNLRRKRYGIGL